MCTFRCFNPKTIIGRSGELVKVPCGKCDACCNNKNERLRTLCDLEAMHHKYCYFVTLTYAPFAIPLCRLQYRNGYFAVSDVTKRLRDRVVGFMDFIPVRDLPSFDSRMFFDKFALPSECYGLIPYLYKPDVQLFMKRLRKKLYRYSHEKIRYVAVGEYGPKHFRPHYHLLLWFDDDEIRKNIRKTVCSSWRYGRVDCQKSKSKLSSYVTKYVNSSSLLSRLHSLKTFKPFSLHSVHLGEQLYAHEIEKVYEVPVKSLIERSFERNGRVARCSPLLSFEHSYFPRCYRYGSLSLHERELCYTLYSRASKDFGTDVISELLHPIMAYLGQCSRGDISKSLQCPVGFPDSIAAFCELIGSELYTDATILSMLYTSKRFLRLKSTYCLSTHHLVGCIDDYWSSKDYIGLCNQLKSQQDMLDKYGFDMRYNLLWYYNDFELIKQSNINEYERIKRKIEKRKNMFLPVYDSWLHMLSLAEDKITYPPAVERYIRSIGYEPSFFNDAFFDLNDNPEYNDFVALNRKIARDAIKHKRQNDANKIFCY